jgi:hypothetical protein
MSFDSATAAIVGPLQLRRSNFHFSYFSAFSSPNDTQFVYPFVCLFLAVKYKHILKRNLISKSDLNLI